MTPEQEAAFNTYGCGSRCLIKLSEIHQQPITREAFLEKFLPIYGKIWGAQIGGTITSTLIDMARALGLCTHADVRTDLDTVRGLIAGGCTGVLVITDRDIAGDGSTHALFHCRLFRGFSADGQWALWEPYQDGSDQDAVCYPDAYMRICSAHFLILYKVVPAFPA